MPMACGVKPSNSISFKPLPGSFIRKTVLLLTVLTSIAPSKGIESRGWRLNPSNWFTSAISAQSDGWVAQLGEGTFTRRPVSCCESKTVKRSLGNGDCVLDCRLKSGCVSARARAGVRTATATRKIMVRRINEYCSVRGVCMAVEDLQGELQGATRTIDLRRKVVNGTVKGISRAAESIHRSLTNFFLVYSPVPHHNSDRHFAFRQHIFRKKCIHEQIIAVPVADNS